MQHLISNISIRYRERGRERERERDRCGGERDGLSPVEYA